MRKSLQLAGFLVLCLCLSACAMRKPIVQANPSIPPSPSVAKLQNWKIEGAIGINDGKQAFSANVVWWQTPARFAMTLYGPVGVGTLKINGTPGKVSLMDSSRKTMQSNSIDDLIKKQTGWTFPADYIIYWIKGMAAPQSPAQEVRDQNQRLTTLTQGNWHINFLNYSQKGGLSLPNKLVITHQNLKIRVVIYQWTI